MSLLDKATEDVFAAVAAEAPHYREDAVTLCDGPHDFDAWRDRAAR